MLHQLDDNGTMAVVLPHGVLFRGAAEGHIRKYLIEQKNCLDTVIGLPANIFYGTPIPTCVLVFKKQRINEGNVLFIDASAHFGKLNTQNHLREEDIERILSAFNQREFKDKFSYVADIKEINEENEFNLNIPRYVDSFEDEDLIDLKNISNQLRKIDKEASQEDLTISNICNDLGIVNPFGEH
jgi:type I restriction enzyme M protein